MPANPDIGLPLDAVADLPRGAELGRVVNLERAYKKYDRHLVDRVVANFSLGDEIGYRAYKDMRALGPRGWPMFERALAEGFENVDGVPQSMAAFFKEYYRVPAYVDYDQLRRGAIAYWRAGAVMPLILSYAGIGASFRNFGGSRPLVFSRLMVDDKTSGRRLTETLRWVTAVTRPDALRPGGEGIKMTARLRMIHGAARYGMSKAKHWDWKAWGLPVDNTDSLSVTSIVFTRSIISALDQSGIRLSPQERADIYALWRYIGHLCAVPEEINFVDELDAKVKGELFRLLDYPADQGCRDLAHSLLRFMAYNKEGDRALPSWLGGIMTPERKLALSYGLIRYWTKPEIYEALDIPKNNYRYVMYAARPLIAAMDRLRPGGVDGDFERATAALATFDEAAAVKEGESPLAEPESVVDAFKRNGPSAAAFFQSKR